MAIRKLIARKRSTAPPRPKPKNIAWRWLTSENAPWWMLVAVVAIAVLILFWVGAA